MTNILNNTILIPYHDSLVSSNPIQTFDPTKKIGELKDVKTDNDKNYSVYIKVKDQNAVKLIALQEVSGFGMKREYEQKIGVNPEYNINLPGPVSYSDIHIKHLFTREKYFLNWLTSGLTLGGIPRAEIEIHITPLPKKDLVFTLYDAFPVEWELTQMDLADKNSALFEDVLLTFSDVHFKMTDTNE